MVLGLRCYSPARRPHPASLSVRVPALAHLLAASFSLALTGSALQFSYRYSHQFGRVHFIPVVLAHAGHTSAAVLCRFSLPLRSLTTSFSRTQSRLPALGLTLGSSQFHLALAPLNLRAI